MKTIILSVLLLSTLCTFSQNYIEWSDKKELFDVTHWSGGDKHATFPKLLIIGHSQGSEAAKKFNFMRISGFSELNKDETIKFCNTKGTLTRKPNNFNEKCLIHIGMVDQENDYHYYQAKTATLKGLGDSMYQLIADFHDVDAAGNDYKNDPNYPNYSIKAVFKFTQK